MSNLPNVPFLKFIYKPKNELEKGGRTEIPAPRQSSEPERRCPNCYKSVPLSKISANMSMCDCGYHFRMTARQRISLVCDSFEELWPGVVSNDPLGFPGYEKKLETVKVASGELEAVVCGRAKIDSQSCAVFVMESYFMMGSMGSAVGEKITRLFEYATFNRLPVVGFTVSGGARMQEGLLSLMQMAKTSGAVRRHSEAGLFYLTVLTDPTMGGVTASFAMEGDIIIAEPGAMVGFAGPRVIEQTTGKTLPKGFQLAESLLEHGFVDAIIPRPEQKVKIGKLLMMNKAKN